MTRSRLLTPLAGLLFTCLATTACVDTPLPKYVSAVDYSAQRPIALNVNQTIVINDSRPSPLTQEFAQKFGTTLDSSIQEWLDKRILPSGPQGTYSVIIRDANFSATSLNKQGGVQGYFTRDQDARWDVQLNVIISVDGNGQNLPQSEVSVNVNASRTVPEKANDHEKSAIYHSLINEVMGLYNKEVESQMQQYLRPYFL